MDSSRTRIGVKEDIPLAVLSLHGDQDGPVVLTTAPDHQLDAAVCRSYCDTGVGSWMRCAVELCTARTLDQMLTSIGSAQHSPCRSR